MITRRTVLGVGALGLTAGATLGLARPAHARGPADPPPVPGATVDDLGSPMSAITVVEGAFGTLPDGRLAAYAATQGENSELNVSTVTDDPPVQVGRFPMTGAGGGPSIVVAPDQTVYVGTYNQGGLYRWDPATSKLHALGSPTEPAEFLYGLTAAPDGTVYGGTYPDARIWSFHPERGFTDLGRVTDDPAVRYVRACAYDPEHHALFAGTSPVAGLYRKDLTTGAVTRVSPAEPFAGTAITDLDVYAGRLLVAGDTKLRVFDTATAAEVGVVDAGTGRVTRTFSITGRGVSPIADGRVWFSSADSTGTFLAWYDLETGTAARTAHRTSALIGLAWRTENDHDVLYAFAGNYTAGALRYDLQADRATAFTLAVSPAPSPLGQIACSPDGSSVLINAFLNGNGVRRDVASGTITPIARLGQVEDWTFVEDASGRPTVYAGIYPQGTLLAYRPDEPGTADNPHRFVQLKPEPVAQIRPRSVRIHRGLLWAATEPEYGQRNGALVTVDLADERVTVTRPVVEDHTMCSLAFSGDRVFAGSSRDGGTGTSPVPGSAVLVEFDAATRTVRRRLTPVTGARSVNALAVHDGRLLGLADTTVFEVDLVDFTVRRTFELPGVSGGAGAGQGELAFHPNGYLYVEAHGTVIVVDPLSLATAATLLTRTRRLVGSADGSLWTLLRPEGFTEATHHVRITPAVTATVDSRWLVWVRDVRTDVGNRFVEPGRTLADVVADAYPPGKPASPKGEAELGRLVADGVITPAERVTLSRAGRG